ncbi:MAG TPA: hypothetical protein VEK08_26990 [Planctomycetota bacterium]|nr:hypothetical protein [Planctomycetota bacterium]
MAAPYTAAAVDARHIAVHRFRADDPTNYDKPKTKRIDAKFTVMGLANEVISQVETRAIGEVVRVKNTTGSDWPAGTLLYPDDSKLTAQTSATAVNNPLAGANVVINLAATFEVGQIVSITSGGKTDYARVTAVSAGASVTVDLLFYDHTAPVVTALPAYEASLADADAAKPAEWVLSAAVANGAYGTAYYATEVTGLDTSALTAEKLLYLSATAGTYTQTAPTGSDQIQQVVGIVKTVHASTGRILFFPGNKRILKFGSSFLQAGIAGTITSTMSLEGVITPTTLAANTNDWNPTSLATSNTIRVAASSAVDLTGITAHASAWQTIILHNVGTFTITLKDESASSSAANRFALDSDDPVPADTSRVLQYDRTSSRWRVIGKGGSGTVGGTGTSGIMPRFTASATLGDSVVRADAARIAVSTALDASYIMKVDGATYFTGGTLKVAGVGFAIDSYSSASPAGTVNDVNTNTAFHFSVTPSANSVYTGLIARQSQFVLIVNSNNPGGFTLRLDNENVGSSAANRIRTFDGSNITLQGGDYALLYYDQTVLSRWLVISSSAGVAWDDRANTFSTAQTFSSYVSWQAGTPATITSDQNDYDFGTVSFARVSSDASRTITGLANGANGRVLIVANVGASPIILPNESPSSVAANRIINPSGASVTLSANYGALLIYDGTSSRWRMISYFQVGGGGTGTIGGSGTNGRVARFSPDSTTITDSLIRDDGVTTAINKAPDAAYMLDVAGKIRSDNQIVSTITTGTAPIVVSSTTKVANLNSDQVDGFEAAFLGKGLTNYLINANCSVWQRSTSASMTDAAYNAPDRWYSLIQGANPTISRTTAAKTVGFTSTTAIQMAAGGTTNRFGVAQVIESQFAVALRSREVTLQFKAYGSRGSGSTAIDVHYAIIEWTGSDDSVTKDVVNTWTSTTYDETGFFASSANHAILNHGSTSLTHAANAASISLTATPSSSMNNLIIFVWFEDQPGHANDTLIVGDFDLHEGNYTRTFTSREQKHEVALCQRYFCKTFALDTAPVQASGTYNGTIGLISSGTNLLLSWKFPVPMRTTPGTVASYNPTQAASTFRNGANTANSGAVTISETTESGFNLTAGTVTDQTTYYIHASADAEL